MDYTDIIRKQNIRIKKLQDELIYAKRERDAAITDITELAKFYKRRTICDFCKYDSASVEECHFRCNDNCFINDCFEWRGYEKKIVSSEYMNFYHAYYKRQYYDEDKKIWKDTCYNHQGIVVIASSYNEAKSKIEMCLTKVETDGYRAILVSDIVECIGLDRRHGYDGCFNVNPILNN